MADIHSPDDWWSEVDANWEHLQEIVFHHLQYNHPAYVEPGNDKTEETGRNIGEELEWLRESRDCRLARYLAAAWSLASDAYAWSVPGWGEFCDLCSEEWVLYEEDADAETEVEGVEPGPTG